VPLVRKPAPPSPPSGPDADAVLKGLDAASPEERWAAARAATNVPGSTAALSAALRSEEDPRVREAIFTAVARIGTPESTRELVSLLRSDDAALRAGALDALRTLTRTNHEFLPRLLQDADADVRILSCELARGLSAEEATTLLCALLAAERAVNVCAAAIDVLAEVGTANALATLADCERRFFDVPFLVFAIRTAMDRVCAQFARTRD
jgi:HEAT repeat protein